LADAQVTCINELPRNDTYEGTHLGSSGWKWTRAQVIKSIEDMTNTFYTTVDGTRPDIGVVVGSNGKYVRTRRDQKWTVNPLALDECP
jgi:hypothetical protein